VWRLLCQGHLSSVPVAKCWQPPRSLSIVFTPPELLVPRGKARCGPLRPPGHQPSARTMNARSGFSFVSAGLTQHNCDDVMKAVVQLREDLGGISLGTPATLHLTCISSPTPSTATLVPPSPLSSTPTLSVATVAMSTPCSSRSSLAHGVTTPGPSSFHSRPLFGVHDMTAGRAHVPSSATVAARAGKGGAASPHH